VRPDGSSHYVRLGCELEPWVARTAVRALSTTRQRITLPLPPPLTFVRCGASPHALAAHVGNGWKR